MSDEKMRLKVIELRSELTRTQYALGEANWTLAKIRDALTWDERSSIKCVAIREILTGPPLEGSEPTA